MHGVTIKIMKVNLKENDSVGMYWIHLTWYENKGLELLDTLMSPWVP